MHRGIPFPWGYRDVSLVEKFLEWLGNRAPEKKGQHGFSAAVADETGLSQPYVWRLLRGELVGDISLSTLERIAVSVGKDAVWQLVKEIEESSAARTVIPIDVKITRRWHELFNSNPARGQHVLDNLKLQEALGYTDTISAIVRSIIREGPEHALTAVGDHLSKLRARETDEQRKKRRKLAKELPNRG